MTSKAVEEVLGRLDGLLTAPEIAELTDRLNDIRVKPESYWAVHHGGGDNAAPMNPDHSKVELHNTHEEEGDQTLSVSFWHGHKDGVPVIQIDGGGRFRVNVNDGPIWDADANLHEHTKCRCSEEK